jgi:hypothetical protein
MIPSRNSWVCLYTFWTDMALPSWLRWFLPKHAWRKKGKKIVRENVQSWYWTSSSSYIVRGVALISIGPLIDPHRKHPRCANLVWEFTASSSSRCPPTWIVSSLSMDDTYLFNRLLDSNKNNYPVCLLEIILFWKVKSRKVNYFLIFGTVMKNKLENTF